MFQIKRPKPGDTEEDLLREQEEFLKSSSKPAATIVRKPDKRHGEEAAIEPMQTDGLPDPKRDVVNLGGLPGQFGHTTGAPPLKKSRFKEKQEQKKKAKFQFDPEEDIESADRHITQVLTEIVERDIQNTPVYYPEAPTTHGFPVAPYRGNLPNNSGDGKAKSIFARQFARGKAGDFGLKMKPVPKHEAMEVQERRRLTRKQANVQGPIGIVSGSGLTQDQPEEEVKKIHLENADKLAAMTEADIMKEQQRLMESLDPSLVAFLRSRKQQKSKHSEELVTADNSDAAAMSRDVVQPMDTSIPVQNVSRPREKTDTAKAGIPIKPKKKWVHMDVVEDDKLKWTKDLPPPPKADYNKTGQPARFDFQGNLLPVDADVPTSVGLHHHGLEPERAGYTLEELFQLARSANMQQRVMAITTIARVLRKARAGSLNEAVQTPIIPALLDGGLIFILRWALDDSTENTMAAAVHCFHALLVCQEDEDAADQVFAWHQGSSLPILQPREDEPENEEEREERQNQADAIVLKKDIIKGLLKMQMLQRLRYILEVWKPAASVVLEILQILTRFVRHSPVMAYEVMHCPRLIDVIFKEFLPTTWRPAGEETALSSVHGYPVPEALKLIRVICAAGKNMAASLVSKYWLMTCISRYIVEDPCDLHLPPVIASNLQIESLRMWQVITQYGLASYSFTDLYPAIMKSLQCLPTLYHMPNNALLQWGAATMGFLESVVSLASTSHQLAVSQSKGYESAATEDTSIPVPEVDWSHVTSLYQPVLLCLQNALKEFVDACPMEKHDLTFAACCMNFIATFISKVDVQPGYNAIEWLENIESLSSSLLPFLSSAEFRKCLDTMRAHSALIWLKKVSRREVTDNLPELGSLVSNDGDVHPLLKETSTLHFVMAVARLLCAIGKLHKDVASKLFPYLLKDEDVVLYLRKCCQTKRKGIASNTFIRFENFLQFYLLQMARIQAQGCDSQLYHHVAMLLLSRLHQGDEHLAHELMSHIIFNPDLLSDITSMEAGATSELENLKLGADKPDAISSATRETIKGNHEYLAKDITDHLSSIRGSYLTVASSLIGHLQRSRSRILVVPHLTDNNILGPVGQLIAPVDWPFLPLVELYNRTSHTGGSEENVSPQLLSLVTDTLRFVYTLEQWRPGVLDSVTFVTKISRLMCTFLAGSDLFLDPKVHLYLESIYKIYCRPVFVERMNFNKKVPGLVSFYDFFILFLIQYEAVSFGDGLFGSYMLLPVQQQHDLQMRKAIWTEHTTILRTFSMPINEIPLPLENFLQPDERNMELIRLYYQALYSGSVTPHWSPLFYLIAVHHVNRFLFSQETPHQDLRRSMINAIHNCLSQDLKRDVLYYKKAERSLPKGMDYYTNLPVHREKTLKEATI